MCTGPSATTGWAASLRVELTFGEVVDVEQVGIPSAMGQCLAAALWAWHLDRGLDRERDVLTLSWP